MIYPDIDAGGDSWTAISQVYIQPQYQMQNGLEKA